VISKPSGAIVNHKDVDIILKSFGKDETAELISALNPMSYHLLAALFETEYPHEFKLYQVVRSFNTYAEKKRLGETNIQMIGQNYLPQLIDYGMVYIIQSSNNPAKVRRWYLMCLLYAFLTLFSPLICTGAIQVGY
jgi:hypothetical protein